MSWTGADPIGFRKMMSKKYKEVYGKDILSLGYIPVGLEIFMSDGRWSNQDYFNKYCKDYNLSDVDLSVRYRYPTFGEFCSGDYWANQYSSTDDLNKWIVKHNQQKPDESVKYQEFEEKRILKSKLQALVDLLPDKFIGYWIAKDKNGNWMLYDEKPVFISPYWDVYTSNVKIIDVCKDMFPEFYNLEIDAEKSLFKKEK